MKRYIAYYRVSTKKQGLSGLGIDAQKASVASYKPVAEFTEIETGTNKRERPELARAIQACKRRGCILVIAKLDRLARNVHFISGLMESGVEFIAADMPSANKLTVHILAAVAEEEARAISTRTKAALAEYKRRGGKLGAQLPQCRNLTPDATRRGRRHGTKANKEAAERFRDEVPVHELRDDGLTLQEIADSLNEDGYRTRRGKPFSPTAVWRILAR